MSRDQDDTISTVGSLLADPALETTAGQVARSLGLTFVPRPERRLGSRERLIWLVQASATPEGVRRVLRAIRRDLVRQDSPIIVVAQCPNERGEITEKRLSVAEDRHAHVLVVEEGERDAELRDGVTRLIAWLVASESEKLTILHLSDLHFGREQRIPETVPFYEGLLTKLAADLGLLREEHQIVPNVLLVTGDLAEESLPSEYEQAGEFLAGLTARLNLERKRVILLPGNHDVNQGLCQAARLQAGATGGEFAEPYFGKFANYREFYEAFHDGAREFDKSELFQVHHFPQERALAVAFNSSVRESEREEDHFGWIGVDQIR